MSNKIAVLLDTDIGSDIDDAVALAYLLKQPRCELLGIATVTGEPTVRAQLADAVCQAFGRQDVPIHSGASKPLLVPQQQPKAPQKKALAHWPHRKRFAPNTAVDFLRQTIRDRPGEITLLSIGPLTNIGLLFALDPEIPRLLKAYVMMGGVYRTHLLRYGLAEWNAKGDPHATAIVFAANVPNMRCVGLDVTTQCQISAHQCRRQFNQGPLNIVREMAEIWFKQRRPEITFHDPLAAACIFMPKLCTFEPGQVGVELQSERIRGMTHFESHPKRKSHQVAVDVDAKTFFEHYFETVGT